MKIICHVGKKEKQRILHSCSCVEWNKGCSVDIAKYTILTYWMYDEVYLSCDIISATETNAFKLIKQIMFKFVWTIYQDSFNSLEVPVYDTNDYS